MDFAPLCRSSTLQLLIFSASLFFTPAFSLGINYGRIAYNLPHPKAVVPLVKSIGATRVKLYDADPHVLKTFANTDIKFIVGLGNENLAGCEIQRKPKPGSSQTFRAIYSLPRSLYFELF